MAEHGDAGTRWVLWLSALALFYTGVAVVLGTQDYLLRPRYGWSVPWFAWVGNRFTQWFVWTGWTPFVVWLGARFRLDQEPRLRNWAIHGTAIVVMVPVIFTSDITLAELLTLPGSGRTFADKLLENFRVPWPLLLGWLLIATLTWLMVLTLSYAWRYRKEGQQRQLEASRLKAELAEAQLHSLKSQLHPHFLFNSLNAIATLTTTDPPTAKRVVLLLSGLLRRALTDANAQEVPLAQEIEFARSYLEIEQTRFSNRLSVNVSVDPRVERALVPHLVLQPLVENAVRHGIGPKAEPGTIRIEAGLAVEGVRLAVIDDGVGRSRESRSDGAGVGLANVRARLARLYGDKARLECGERAEGGFTASVVVPLRPERDGHNVAAAIGGTAEAL
jgi:two-component system, LytTR family, sensor kinase